MVMPKCLGAAQVCFHPILDSSFASPCCYFLLLTSSIWKKDTDDRRISGLSQPLLYTTWNHRMRLWWNGATIWEWKPFPVFTDIASDSREDGKVQLFSEVNIKLLCWRHRVFQLVLEVTRILMKCSTSPKCLKILLHEGYSGHMVSSNCQETFADFAWEVSV